MENGESSSQISSEHQGLLKRSIMKNGSQRDQGSRCVVFFKVNGEWEQYPCRYWHDSQKANDWASKVGVEYKVEYN